MPERRRFARVEVPLAPALRLGVSFSAQVLEISLSGVLLASKSELSIGERGSLHAKVRDRLLDVAIAVRDVSEETRMRHGARYRIGAAFVDMTAEQRVLLEEMLGVERN
jgi:c-di-GMP-binding flagellar brake protein YcgR